MSANLKKFGTHILVILGFVFVSLLYFSPVLKGHKIYQSDIVQYTGMAKQHTDFREANSSESYWTNSAFGGMPTYQLGAKYPHNYIKKLDLALRFLPRPADYLFLYLIGFYILLLVLKIDYRMAAFGALAFGFSTYLIIILGVGHNAKAHAIAYMPLVLSGIILTFQKRYAIGFSVTAISSGLELVTNHPQMTYYLLILILILGISYLVQSIKSKEVSAFFKALAVLSLAAFLALGMNATNLLATSSYAKESTRSKSELTINFDGSVRDQSSGLDKAYITQFSYGILETFNLFIPRFMGGGNRENLGKDSETYKAYRALGATPLQSLKESKQAPMYWGDQPIVEAPAYIGAVVIFLFVLALFLYHGRFKWWLLIGILLSLLLSYGKNLSFLTDLFIDYVPLYNKFRAVSSIQVILELCIPLLATLGLSQVFNKEVSSKTKLDALKKASAILVGIAVVFLVFKNSFFDFVGATDGQFLDYYGASFVEALRLDRSAIFSDDTLRTLLFTLAAGALIFAYLKQKISQNITITFLVLALVLDLVTVDRRYVNSDNFVTAIQVDIPYQSSSINQKILKDTTIYRVLDRSDNSTQTSYFHNAIGGYHAAKLRRFKELQEFHIDKNNFEVLNMLNTKYIIYKDNEDVLRYFENEEINGNAWFVDSVKAVQNADEEIMALAKLKSKLTAISRASKFDSKRYSNDSTAAIKLVDYKLNKLVYESNNTADGFAVFSEIYYKDGWNATIDGEAVEHINVNYVLRGLEIPKGTHEIVFEFSPIVVKKGSSIALISSISLLFLILGQVVLIYKTRS
ncbi:MAG: YfhO family protein [Flavobacteriales bacterium]|tara:strand:- start:1349 stop:3757 length:2409 start_codon:yes stop_codon:yes gene_type:complete